MEAHAKPQLRCYGRRNRSKSLQEGNTGHSHTPTVNGQLQVDDRLPSPQASQSSLDRNISSPRDGKLPVGDQDMEAEEVGSHRNHNAGKEAQALLQSLVCVQATEVLDELPPPRFKSEEEQVAYEEEALWKADEIWARQEALEHVKRVAPRWKEPQHGKTHWDYLLQEMIWLSNDFDKERKYKINLAKKLAHKAAKEKSEIALKGMRRVKTEEQRVRRIASNIAKEVKKFWDKIEKLVVYKHQLAVEEKKKKALDKHLDFLLGQTERYSSMLAVNLSNVPEERQEEEMEMITDRVRESTGEAATLGDKDFVVDPVEEEDDEATLEADEAMITEAERKEELDALEREGDLPLEELLRRYARDPDDEEEDDASFESEEGGAETDADTDDEGCETSNTNGIGKDVEDKSSEEETRATVPDATLQSDRSTASVKHEKLSGFSGDDSSDEAKERMGEPSTSGRNSLLIVRDNAKSKASAKVDDEYADVLANVARVSRQRSERVRRRDENRQEAGKTGRKDLDEAAAAAQSAQPTGYTYSTTRVRTKLPFLLKHSLREYQHIGLDWLVTMYEKRLNGILADEMGLGKTIMTIALLAHLACEKGIWGPHLIVVPTSVMLNWETEFMKWCPAFKILTYFGNAKERKIKRQGWSKANSFHICITTYRLVVQDAKAFKRKKWKYLILDEAHLIKNWKSQRWQMLLNFNSKRRILLTGTPLQNDLMELWSLMHFLMPHVFQSHQEFKDWFSNPITGMIEGQEKVNQDVVDRLHNVLRPFILRRLKRDVEKQLPGKHEHVVSCRLSKRQRNLYEDFMASSDTQATLSSGNFLGLINVLMQLRKVCNHPDLFEGRPIVSSFDMPPLELQLCSELCSVIQRRNSSAVDLEVVNLLFADYMESWEVSELNELATPRALIEEIASTGEDGWDESEQVPQSIFEEIQRALSRQRLNRIRNRARHSGWLNMLRCSKQMIYGAGFRRHVDVESPVDDIHTIKSDPSRYLDFSSALTEVVKSPSIWCEDMMELLQSFVFVIPPARAPPPVVWCSRPQSRDSLLRHDIPDDCLKKMSDLMTPLRPVVVRQQLFFPDRRLLQFDCGKLQELSILLRRLKSEGHRALIFTQMTKMLDILESFINLYGYTYMRLDGSTKPEQRQILMQRFNTNSKIFLFILSTRSGGVGINLVGADTVIFYDSDWNPAMDQQAQDRCHRIGQTREVHIYRLVSESTIEENILKKANQKRFLDDLVIQSGGYNTEFFKKLDPMELLSGGNSHAAPASKRAEEVPSIADVDAALKSAEDEADYMAMKNVELEEAAEIQEFTEEVSVEDDECADDVEDGKAPSEPKVHTPEQEPSKEHASKAQPMLMDVDEDMDMLADVKQLAAAAAASGRGSTYFEDQLKPIERYAIKFRDQWDPLINTDALETQVNYEEKEWELEQLEKLKEEQEAEIDEDEEPLLYESWDTAQADAVYKQHVEILAQQQESLEAEWEAMQEQELEEEARHDKKAKKRKFKSIGKGDVEIEYQTGTPEAHASELDEPVVVEVQCIVAEDMDFDMQWRFSRKRKLSEEEFDYQSKRFKDITGGYRPTQGKRPVLLLDRDSRRSNSTAGTDPWVPAEEVVLCAVVNEYGDNWLLASDALDGMPEGERYRGRHRHPLKCKDGYRQLVIQNACGDSANAILRLTEEDTKRLLKLVEHVPDNEMLLQRHFATILKVKDSYCSKSAKGFMSTVGQPRNFPFVSVADLTLPCSNQPVDPSVSKIGNALVAEALRSVGQEQENGKLAENKAVKRVNTMELLLSFPEPGLDDFVPVNVTLEDDEEITELTPSTAIRSQQVCEDTFRLAASMTPSELADAACRLDNATRQQLPAPRRQSPLHDVTRQQRIKQARLQPVASPPSITKNGMVEIRPVEIETTVSPSLLRSAILNESASIFSVSHRSLMLKPSKSAARPRPSTPASQNKTATPVAQQKPAQSRVTMNASTNHTINSNKAGAVAAAAAAQQLPFAQYWRSNSSPGTGNIRPPVVSKAANHQQHSQVRQQGQQQQQQQQQRTVQQRQQVQVKRPQQMPQRQQQQQQQRPHLQQVQPRLQHHPRPMQQSQQVKPQQQSLQPRPQQQLHQSMPSQQSQQQQPGPQQQLQQQQRLQQQPHQLRPQMQQPRPQVRPPQQQVQHPRPQHLYQQHPVQQPRSQQQQFPQQPRTPLHFRPAVQHTKPLLEQPRTHTQLLQQQHQLRQLQHQQAPDVSLSLTLGPPVQRKPSASQ